MINSFLVWYENFQVIQGTHTQPVDMVNDFQETQTFLQCKLDANQDTKNKQLNKLPGWDF